MPSDPVGPDAADTVTDDLTPSQEPRRLRSFVRREGRITPGQQRALQDLSVRLGLPDGNGRIDLDQLFGRQAPRTLEIGFGNGLVLATLAEAEPEHDFIGIEVYRPGLGRLLGVAGERGLDNLRLSGDDAVELLGERFSAACLDRIMVFFPDPWPKKRHHKRRIIQPESVALMSSRLKPGGRLYLATDWAEYADWMLEVLEAESSLSNLHGAGQWAPRAAFRPVTRFEQRGQRLGHGVWDLAYQRDVAE